MCVCVILVVPLLWVSCGREMSCPIAINVDSLVVYNQATRGEGKVIHCIILQDSILKIKTKHTSDTIVEITNQDDIDAFTTYMKMFYTEQTAETGEDSIHLTKEGYYVEENYYDCRTLIVKGYKGNSLVLNDTTFVDHAYFHDDYYRLLDLIKRMSNKYEALIFQTLGDKNYPENINQYNEHGQMTGKWVSQNRNSVIVSNYVSGKLDGMVKQYSITGELELIKHYKMGVLINAYSLRGLTIYKNIRKASVNKLYNEQSHSEITIHYIADRISYGGFEWSKSNGYFYDGEDDLRMKAYCDSVLHIKDPYNTIVKSYTTVPNSINVIMK